ncbi:hypothetical protein FOZ60_013735 [Perkinsus olseni]|uniref:Uncharacterized protein n=1 Tax=Perkinsus olseni TaxID=32597 RepID=A0A7J6NA06_PEROL|nr:hypothetical protein FOZ60_013735 [Perkinsus olseni]
MRRSLKSFRCYHRRKIRLRLDDRRRTAAIKTLRQRKTWDFMRNNFVARDFDLRRAFKRYRKTVAARRLKRSRRSALRQLILRKYFTRMQRLLCALLNSRINLASRCFNGWFDTARGIRFTRLAYRELIGHHFISWRDKTVSSSRLRGIAYGILVRQLRSAWAVFREAIRLRREKINPSSSPRFGWGRLLPLPMSRSVRESVQQLPGTAHENSETRRDHVRLAAVTSSVLLQRLLHLNAVFDALLFAPGTIIAWILKAASSEVHERSYQVLLPMVIVVLALEGPRLALGYSGNLGERVPHLFLWLVISIFPLLVTLVAILVTRNQVQELTAAACPSCLTSFEVVLICLEIALVSISVLVGIAVTRRLIAVKTFRFYEQYFVTSMTEWQPPRF